MQTKKQSLIESIANTAVGFAISLASIFIILPALGIESTWSKNITITIYFTVISILRSYVIRRYFTKKTTVTLNVEKIQCLRCYKKRPHIEVVDDFNEQKTNFQKEQIALPDMAWFEYYFPNYFELKNNNHDS